MAAKVETILPVEITATWMHKFLREGSLFDQAKDMIKPSMLCYVIKIGKFIIHAGVQFCVSLLELNLIATIYHYNY